MNYIIMDMEWNQPWPGSPSSKKVLPVQIRGEIIQIGAVRLTEDQQVGDEFQVMIRPKFYRRLNRRVSKLTGIKEAELRDNGIPMAEAMEQFPWGRGRAGARGSPASSELGTELDTRDWGQLSRAET